jgi:DNA-3-methyladenine glycosylase
MTKLSVENHKLIACQFEDINPIDLIRHAKPFGKTFYDRDAVDVTRDLIGSLLVRELNGETLAGFIVEAEAYKENEPACHAHRGRTKRTEVMFGPGGHAYIYFVYGMYWCLNATSEPNGKAAASLIRAVEPITGMKTMRRLRNRDNPSDLCSGPGKLTMAFGLDGKLNKQDLSKPPLRILALPDDIKPRVKVRRSERIGLAVAKDLKYRFYADSNPHVSR